MSIVGESFPVDVFLSYRWSDVRGTGDSGFMQWVRHFKEALESELEASLEEFPEVFLDQTSVSPTRMPVPQLERKAKEAAFFVPLISRHYPKSDWCREELVWWREKQRERGLDEDGRLLPVLAWGPPDDDPEWERLCSERGFKIKAHYFHSRIDSAKHPHPFGWPERHSDKIRGEEFNEVMMDFSTDLDREIRLFKGQLAERRRKEEAASSRAARTLKMYLHGLAGAEPVWSSLSDAMTGGGLEVAPGKPQRIAGTLEERLADQERMVEALDTCDGLVMIAPEDDDRLAGEAIFSSQMTRLALTKGGQPKQSIPIAVVDPVTEPGRAAVRERFLQTMQISRFALHSPGLADEIGSYVREKLR